MPSEMKLRKKAVVKLPQATLSDRLPKGKRRGCTSRMVREVLLGAKKLNLLIIELSKSGLTI